MSSQTSGPPYLPTTAGVGGQSTVVPDIPICAILVLLYAGAAAGHMALLQINRRAGIRFLISSGFFGFCMARILTCSLRIGVATHPTNINLSIAANIFLNAGILIVYVANLLFAQRVLRARQPTIGWHPVLRIVFKVLYFLIVIFLVLVITFIVLQFYTLDENLRRVCRDIQLAAITYFLIFTVLPYIFLAIAFILPESARSETFGRKGSLETKALVILVSTTLCTINAGFKAGVIWETPRPRNDPAWYDSKAAFYCFYFVVEILLIYFLLLVRVDKLFWVPNGSSKRQTYFVRDAKLDELNYLPGTAGSDRAYPGVAQEV